MLPRPATMVTAVVVTFAVAGVVRLSTNGMKNEPSDRGARYVDNPVDNAGYQPEAPADYEPEVPDLAAMEEPDTTPASETLDEIEVDTDAAVATPAGEELLHAIDAIEALVKDGRRSCDELGQPSYDVTHPGAAGDEHIARWTDFARTWDDDVSRAASRMPSPPSWDADPQLRSAYQEVSASVRELRQATVADSESPVPFEKDWSAHFDAATRLLGQARARLASR